MFIRLLFCVYSLESEFKLLVEVSNEVFDLNAFLLHCVTVTNCYAAVLFECIEVISDAERSTDLVLTAVTLTDLTCFVVFNVELLGKHRVNFHCRFFELLCERKNCCLYRCKGRVEVHNRSYVALADSFLIVSVANDSEEKTLNAE